MKLLYGQFFDLINLLTSLLFSSFLNSLKQQERCCLLELWCINDDHRKKVTVYIQFTLLFSSLLFFCKTYFWNDEKLANDSKLKWNETIIWKFFNLKNLLTFICCSIQTDDIYINSLLFSFLLFWSLKQQQRCCLSELWYINDDLRKKMRWLLLYTFLFSSLYFILIFWFIGKSAW